MLASRLILFYGLSFTQTIVALNSGDVCAIEGTSKQGICKNLKKCPTITYGVLNQNEPTMCGFEGEQRIVCCPDPIQEITTERRTSENSLSQQKCQEYSAKIGQCDHKSNQLTFNNQANPKEFPHIAIIGFKRDGDVTWSCVGTLISDEYVFTAAHCITSQTNPPKYIRLGYLDVKSDSDDAKPETFNITQIIPHPDFTPPVAYNDIGLLRMDRKVKFSQYIHPACLPTTSDIPDTAAIIPEWDNQFLDKSSYMLKFRVSKISTKECNLRIAQFRESELPVGIQKTQICGITTGSGCQGTSGAPLQIEHSSSSCMRTVSGITSFGRECGLSFPIVYTKVFPYIGWIESIVWNK